MMPVTVVEDQRAYRADLYGTVTPLRGADYDSITHRALLIAALLSRSAERAEAAVLKAIGWINLAVVSEQGLILTAARAAIAAPQQTGAEEQPHDLASIVPENLRGVLTLPRELRLCFVLRLLLNVPQKDCAAILRIAPEEVNRFSTQAAVMLAAHELKRRSEDDNSWYRG